MAVFDFHAHILPGADHGSRGMATTAAQLCMMRANGTEAVVATPHFYPHVDALDTFLSRRASCAVHLCHHLPENAPAIYLGAEVLVCAGLDRMPRLERLAVYGTNVILLEMPFRKWTEDVIETVFAVRERGLFPVLAHIDRYPRESVAQLLESGIKAQLNAELFSHWRVHPFYQQQLENGSVTALGSDLHGARRGGYRNFVRMRRKLGAAADEVFDRTTALLADAKPLEVWHREKYGE